jgi:integral membrane protein (TIGR01906 family)
MVVLSPPVTHILASINVDTANSQLDHDTLVATADAVRDFSLGNDNAPLPKGTNERVAITPDAISHLLDVRAVFIGMEIAAAITTVLFLLLLVYLLKKRGRQALAKPLIIAGIAPLALTLVLAILATVNFYALFAAMHSLFFADGTWTFAYNSLLICALPTNFWIGCAAIWAVTLVLFCAVSVVVGIRCRGERRTPA